MNEPMATPCSHEPDLFFSHSERKIQRALAACATCPFIQICREEALRNDERHGIWGGLTEDDRRRARTRSRGPRALHHAVAA